MSFLTLFLTIFPLTTHASILSRAPNNLGLVGYWPMDEGMGTKAMDYSGRGNTGSITGATWTSGKHGKALSFDGNDDVISTPLVIPTQTFTVAMWIKGNSPDNDILFSQDSTGSADIGLLYNSAGTKFAYQNTAGGASVARDYTLDGNWHHVVLVDPGTANNDDAKLYVDGILISATDTGAASNPSNTTFYIGGRSDGSADWTGKIDDVRIYNRALTAAEISKLYKSGGVKVGASSANMVAENNPSNAVIGLVRQDCTGYANCSTSLANWQTYMRTGGGISWGACATGNLVCAGKVAVAKIDGPWSSADTAQFTIAGWTTGADNYIKIYTTTEARHDGKRNTSKYRLIPAASWDNALLVNEDYVRIEGLQISNTGGSDYGIRVRATAGTLGVRLTDTIVYDVDNDGVHLEQGGAILNNVVSMGNGGYGIYIGDWDDNTYYIYNCSIVDNGNGVYVGGYRTANIKNSYSGGNTGTDYSKDVDGVANLTTSYSEDGTLSTPTAAFSTTSGARFKNVTAGSEDLHIKDLSVLKGKGTDLSTDSFSLFNTDIDNQKRVAPWDVGIDQIPRMSVNTTQTRAGGTLDSGLVGYWTFDGKDISGASAVDKSGNGNTGTISGATKTMGKLGQALSFNGVNSNVDTTGSYTITTGVTYSAWIKPTAANFGIITSEFGSGEDKSFYFTSDKKLELYISPVFGDVLISNTVLILNQWYHVAAVYTGSKAYIYVNGVQDINSIDTSGSVTNTNGTQKIGSNGVDPYPFLGAIDDVRIYNRALSAAEVKQLYNLGR